MAAERDGGATGTLTIGFFARARFLRLRVALNREGPSVNFMRVVTGVPKFTNAVHGELKTYDLSGYDNVWAQLGWSGY